MRPTVVLDKSFLQGASGSIVRALASTHRLLMSDALFYELLSSEEPGRSRCFAKLPRTDNPVDLIIHVGGLLKLEIETGKSAGRPSQHVDDDLRFQFHPDLALGSYQLPSEAQAVVAEQTEELRSDVASFIDRVRLIPSSFPDLLVGSDAARRSAREDAERMVAEDTEALLEFYGGLKAPTGQHPLPPVSAVDRDWALFRWLQVQLLFALDVYCRYAGNLPDELTPGWYTRMEHDVLDAQYLILGVLEGSFATREKKLKRWWGLINPSGALHE